jgi:beta-galactosidase
MKEPPQSSYFGIVDLAGLPKDRYYLYQSKWSDKPVFHVLPHWTWPERLNQKFLFLLYHYQKRNYL